MAQSGLVWQVPPSVLARNIESYAKRLLDAVFELAQVFAARIEAYAKANAPWTDRTGNARQGLAGRAYRMAASVVIYLFGSVDYQIYLETKHAGRYAIILRSLETHYAPLMSAIRGLVGGR